MRTVAVLLSLCALGATGCTRKVPDHLRLSQPDAQDGSSTTQVEVTDLASALHAMVGSDPLVRAPKLLEIDTLGRVDGGEPVGAYVATIQAIERGESEPARALQQLEEEWPGSAAVPLARGYRLRIVENRIANLENYQEAVETEILGLITPLQSADQENTLPRRPLAWLADEQSLAEVVSDYGDQRVLSAWLGSPDIPLSAVAEAIGEPRYTRLRQTELGKLIMARASGQEGAFDEAFADLRRATLLALTQAAADRDSEQAAWSDLKKEAAAELQTDAPIAFLLGRAIDGLTASAGDDRAGGGALLAIAALRWTEKGTASSGGVLDRVETMRAAGRWHTEVAALSEVWRVIALKEAFDTMDVGHESVLFPHAMVLLVDALIGTTSAPLEAHLLRRRRPDPAVWLAVARAVGIEGVTDWAGARVAVGTHLEQKATSASEVSSDPELTALLKRSAARAVP